MAPIRFAGIAGGVGTTVAAAVAGGIDLGRDVGTADVVVARNDFRCLRALAAFVHGPNRPHDPTVLLIVEPNRVFTPADFCRAIDLPIVDSPWSPQVARADDANLLNPGSIRSKVLEQYRNLLCHLEAWSG